MLYKIKKHKIYRIFFLFILCLACWGTYRFIAPHANPVANLPVIRSSYVPNIAFAQAFIIEEKGWDLEEGFDLQLNRFQAAPFALQSYANGDLDILYTILTSILASHERGIDLQIIAGSTIDQIEIYANEEFQKIAQGKPLADAIHHFTKTQGHKPKIVTFARGVAADIFLRLWILEQESLTLDDVELVNVAAQNQLQQAIFSGSFDLICAFEPLFTIARSKGLAIEPVLRAKDLIDPGPITIVAAGPDYIKNNPGLVEKFLRVHQKATDYIRANPEEAAPYIHKYMGKGFISEEITRDVTKRAIDQFNDDPHILKKPTEKLIAYMQKAGLIQNPITLDDVFQTDLYDQINQ